MNYVAFTKTANNLRIELLPEGRQYVQDAINGGENIDSDDFFRDLIEYQLCNGWEIIPPEDIGALTAATILSDEADRDDSGTLTRVGTVYSNIAFYQVWSAVEEMMKDGYVNFAAATE